MTVNTGGLVCQHLLAPTASFFLFVFCFFNHLHFPSVTTLSDTAGKRNGGRGAKLIKKLHLTLTFLFLRSKWRRYAIAWNEHSAAIWRKHYKNICGRSDGRHLSDRKRIPVRPPLRKSRSHRHGHPIERLGASLGIPPSHLFYWRMWFTPKTNMQSPFLAGTGPDNVSALRGVVGIPERI